MDCNTADWGSEPEGGSFAWRSENGLRTSLAPCWRFIKKNEGIKCLSLGFCGDTSLTGQECKKLLHLCFPEAQWMTQLVVADEKFNLVEIGVDGGHGITLSEHLLIDTG